MALRDLTDPSAVLTAISEADRLGEAAFLHKYGFKPSTRYRIEHDGRTYVSKALLAAAHGVQFPDEGPLSYTDLSGGAQVIGKARELGFAVRRIDGGAADELGVALARFMGLFSEARQEKFSHANPTFEAITSCASLIKELLPVSLEGATVRPSVGQGKWAAVPWIAVLHPHETATTQRGIYPVLLFHEDMQSVEVTIAQGVTELNQALGRRAAMAELERRSNVLRADLEPLGELGFNADSDFDLGRSSLARNYVASTVVHRRFTVSDLPRSTVSDDLAAALDVYGDLLVAGRLADIGRTGADPVERRALMVYVGQDTDANLASGDKEGWWGWKEAPSGVDELRPGDLIAFARGFGGSWPPMQRTAWQSRDLREVLVGRVVTTPERTDREVMPTELAGGASYPWKIRFEHLGTEVQVPLAPGQRLSELAVEGLRRSALDVGFSTLVPVAGSPLLEAFVNNDATPLPMNPGDVANAASAFAVAVEASGLRLPPEDVTAFLAAMLAKPFVILTGQSGSGKTQLAKRLGEWFGSDASNRPRYHVVPVRPDWTGPEYLFGYPDALQSSGGAEVWAVPDTLEFIIRAVEEPDAPHLLVLDEMNLAHVERYFADFLSGVESREPVLPELKRLGGQWRATGNSQRLPLPRNLFVAGTVNVDETTYLFSPKVLDRAFTFEFRPAAADLDPFARRPTSIPAAGQDYQRLLVRVASDDNWQHDHPHHATASIAEDLRSLHALLSPSGHEYGHRVMYESMRFAALLGAMGLADRWAVLDRIVLTKVLPKMHGTRSRIEKPLRTLREFAQGSATDEQPARMPLTANKLDRMLTVVVEAQFVSFTE